ncbi:MAG: bacterioferritin-associated ferredoxin [Planctomycetota bacterium]
MDLDGTLCYCFHISKRKIVNYITRERPPRASQVSACFGAGTGCGWCIPFLIRLHKEIVGDEVVEGIDITDAEYEAMRAAYRNAIAAGEREPNQHDGAQPTGPKDPTDNF